MGLRRALIDTLFGGNKDPLSRIIKQTGDATSPNGVTTAPIGTFLLIDYNGDDADNDVYINTNGTTGWSLVYDASAIGHLY